MPPSVERKIFFYRVDAGQDNAGRPIPFDHIPVLEYLNELPWTTQGRYWLADDGKVICCWVDRLNHPSRIRIGNIRREDLPQVEQAGNLSPLGIPPQSGIVEQIHAIFFDGNIVGADFNFYGPRLPRLAYYLSAKAQGVAPPIIHFEALLRQDVAEQLNNFQSIRLFQLKARASFAQTISAADQNLGSAFEAAARAGEADEIEIILKPTAYSRGRLSDRLLQTVRQLAQRQELRNETKRFIVQGFDQEHERMVRLDLLNDKLIAQKSIVMLDNRTRALDTQSAFSAIEQAYNELRDHIHVAAGVR